ncbi:MAG TPA: hypothetical protein VHT50_08275 [Mycobacterium sp.]|jgi:hypothetical protein|nr:hypothetical protein [Mycobacterium sp.]
MDTFTIETRRSWLTRALGGNPLVRSSDRIEAWSFVMAALILAVATPFICAFGTSSHDSRARSYAEEAMHRHSTTAIAIEGGERVVDFEDVSYTVQAKWNRSGQDHLAVVEWPNLAKIGDQHRIWVDDNGQPARPPLPPSRATIDAWAMALSGWVMLLGAIAGAQYAIRLRLDRIRLAQWDLEVTGLLEGGDRKKSQ